eukprot:7381512-Prymnesium_polylepis.2
MGHISSPGSLMRAFEGRITEALDVTVTPLLKELKHMKDELSVLRSAHMPTRASKKTVSSPRPQQHEAQSVAAGSEKPQQYETAGSEELLLAVREVLQGVMAPIQQELSAIALIKEELAAIKAALSRDSNRQ